MEEQKKYGISRIEKIKLCDGGEAMGRLKHAFREFKNDSSDPELTPSRCITANVSPLEHDQAGLGFLKISSIKYLSFVI